MFSNRKSVIDRCARARLRLRITGYPSVLRFACFCAVLLLAGFALPAPAQQPTPEEMSSAPKPKDPRTRAQAHTELGSVYFQDGNLIVALEELTLAAAIDPDYAPAFATRGLVLYYVKEFESAEKDFRHALDLEERNPDINNNYGWFLCQTGRERESLQYFERAYRNTLYQTPANAYLNAGACMIKLNELDEAQDALERSLRIVPDNPQAMYHLADISYRRGNFDAAKKRLGEVVRRIEPGPEVLWLLLRTERRLGNRADEKSLATQLRRKFPESDEYQELLKGNYQ
ncbi:MAG: type IV pilus biogenesis/stability protein PilW [Candidatus Accumulibacter sp.]|jgi:type IV pilus assembly protein PilF|nr:type IV pilus biogenesis/stability protein PilW [Accumulibacter sp.]